MKNKLNCVEMKYKGAAKIQEQINDYNFEEELNFWKSRSNDLKIRKKICKPINLLSCIYNR